MAVGAEAGPGRAGEKTLAVITGASSGIGEVFARKLAANYDLLLVARRKELLDALAAELTSKHGTVVTTMAADLTDEVQLAAVATAIRAQSNLGLLVNNAGFGLRGAFWKSDLAMLEKMHRLNVMALVRLTHAALNVLVARNLGAIINVASVAGFVPRAGSASYGATKSWVKAFTEGLYLDLQRAGSAVKVQALCPGYTYSEFHDTMGINRDKVAPPSLWLQPEAVVDASLRALPSGRPLVVPGWRYKVIVALITKLPLPLRLAMGRRASGRKR